MVADISEYFDYAASSAVGVSGLDLPDISPGVWKLDPVAKCAACPNRAVRDGGDGRHGDCFQSLSIEPENRRGGHAALIELRNKMMRNRRREHEAKAIMGFAAGSSRLGKDYQNLTNTTLFGRWQMTGASGSGCGSRGWGCILWSSEGENIHHGDTEARRINGDTADIV